MKGLHGAWRVWRERRDCFHHDNRIGKTWIDGWLIDTGMRKMHVCSRCGKVWIV